MLLHARTVVLSAGCELESQQKAPSRDFIAERPDCRSPAFTRASERCMARDDPRSVTQQRGSDMGPAIAYYAIVGLIGAALAAWFLLSTVEAIAGGYCDPGAAFLCHYPQDFVAPSIAAVVGVTLLGTAWRLRRVPPRFGPLVVVGAAIGVAVPLLPIGLVLWAIGPLGSLDIFGPSNIPATAVVLVFGLPLLWALASGDIARRRAPRRWERRTLAIALVAPLIALLLILVAGRAAGITGSWQPAKIESVGTMTLRLERPIELVDAGDAECELTAGGDELSVYGDGQLQVEGQPVYTVALGAAGMVTAEPEASADSIWLSISVGYSNTDRGADVPVEADNIVERRLDGSSGSVRFARVVPVGHGGGLPSPLDEAWEGTVEWTCPTE
jgi:hypothetical protein